MKNKSLLRLSGSQLVFGLDGTRVSMQDVKSCSVVLRLSFFVCVCVCRPSAQVRSGRAAVTLDKLGDEDGSEDGQEEHTDT